MDSILANFGMTNNIVLEEKEKMALEKKCLHSLNFIRVCGKAR
jgi:hypothetical protein